MRTGEGGWPKLPKALAVLSGCRQTEEQKGWWWMEDGALVWCMWRVGWCAAG